MSYQPPKCRLDPYYVDKLRGLVSRFGVSYTARVCACSIATVDNAIRWDITAFTRDKLVKCLDSL